MILNRNYRGAAAVARLVLGLALTLLAAWLVSVNILLSAFGLVSAFDGSVNIAWDGIWPILVGGNGQNIVGEAAGKILGALASIVQVLYWNGDIDWDNADWTVRTIIISIIGFDVVATVWGLTNGVFLASYTIGAALRLLLAVALTVFAFSIGAERWGVMGWKLISYNWREVAMLSGFLPRPKGGGDQQRKHEGFQGPPPGMALMDPEELKRIRDERSRQNNPQDNGSNKQRRQAEERNRQAQEQFRKGNRG